MGKVISTPKISLRNSGKVSNFSSIVQKLASTVNQHISTQTHQPRASYHSTNYKLQPNATIKAISLAENKDDAKIKTLFDKKNSEMTITSDQPFTVNIMSDSPVLVNQSQESKVEVKTVAYSNEVGC